MNLKGHLGVSSLLSFPYLAGSYDSLIKYISYICPMCNDFLSKLTHIYHKSIDDIFNNNPSWILIYFLVYLTGVKAPDIDQYLKSFYINSKGIDEHWRYHRQITHSLLLYLLLIWLTVKYENPILLIFVYGVFTHLFADMLTGTIPIFLYGSYIPPVVLFQRIGIDSFVLHIKGLKKLITEPIKKSLVQFGDMSGEYIFNLFLVTVFAWFTFRVLTF